jgi:hypothetical protein
MRERMNVAEMRLEEIRQRGIDALVQELGPVGMVRFLQQFETGRGDYTSERHQWLPDDIQAIVEEVQRQQDSKSE